MGHLQNSRATEQVSLTKEEVNEIRIKTNIDTLFPSFRRIGSSIPVDLTLHDWYGVFARELAEGKWWQVVYDLQFVAST
jgi:hypothetical protein